MLRFLAPKREPRDEVVLFITHVLTEPVEACYETLRRQAGSGYDVRLLCNRNGNYPGGVLERHPEAFLFDRRGPHSGYGRVEGRPVCSTGTVANALLDFWERHQGFRHAWVVEFDVRFTGSWLNFFDHFADSDADLLATTVVRRPANPGWAWWSSLRPPEGEIVAESEQLRAFLPLTRLSRAALEQLKRGYGAGWDGHYEVLWATYLHRCGLKVEDIGGDGEFVRPENRLRFYWNTPDEETLSPGTFVWRRARRVPGPSPNTLFHPVKTDEAALDEELSSRWPESRARTGAARAHRLLSRLRRRLSSAVEDL